MNASVITLKASSRFKDIAKNGRRWVTPSFIVQVLDTGEKDIPFNVGYTASRRVGGAVERNRAKRRLREVVRHLINEHSTLSGFDMVLIAKVEAKDHPLPDMYRDLKWALRKLDVLSNDK